jgi:hypothetical protein
VTGIIFSKAMARFTKLQPSLVANRSRIMDGGRKGFLWLLLPMLLNCPLVAMEPKQDAPPVNADQINKAVESPIKYAGVLYKSGGRRDPFINPLLLKKKAMQQEDEEVSRGVPPPGIAGTYIAQAVFQGIAVRENVKVAVVRGSDSRAYFLKAGDKLFDGYVKDIQLDSITLVRETRLKSGKTLTQDVTKRLRTP